MVLKSLVVVAGLTVTCTYAQIDALNKVDYCGPLAKCFVTDSTGQCALGYCQGPPQLGSCAANGPEGFTPIPIVLNQCCNYNSPYACGQSLEHGGNGNPSASVNAQSSTVPAAAPSVQNTSPASKAATMTGGLGTGTAAGVGTGMATSTTGGSATGSTGSTSPKASNGADMMASGDLFLGFWAFILAMV